MAQRILLLVLAAGIACSFSACKDDPKEIARIETEKRKAEKKQNAIKHYDTLVKKYPNAPQAEKAKERLRTLGTAATPKKK